MKIVSIETLGVLRSEIKTERMHRLNIKQENATLKTNVIGYWARAALLAFAILNGGAAEMTNRPENVEGSSGAPGPAWSKNLKDTWATQRYLAGKELDGQLLRLSACKEAANIANSSW